MADAKLDSIAKTAAAVIALNAEAKSEAPKVLSKPALSLPVKAVRVIPEPFSRTPGNEPMDIVEIDLGALNDGNFAWHAWMDCLRFRVQRGHADAALALMGIKR